MAMTAEEIEHRIKAAFPDAKVEIRDLAGDGDHYAAPVVLANANTDMLLANEETFGPVAPLFRFDTEAEAIAIANGTPFGLAAYFYT